MSTGGVQGGRGSQIWQAMKSAVVTPLKAVGRAVRGALEGVKTAFGGNRKVSDAEAYGNLVAKQNINTDSSKKAHTAAQRVLQGEKGNPKVPERAPGGFSSPEALLASIKRSKGEDSSTGQSN